jgi:nicotinamide phosphoribosyltransferase
MKIILPVLLKDFYKVGHKAQYPDHTSLVYSNLTPRGTRRTPSPSGVVWFGLQYFIKEYLMRQFNVNFFGKKREDVLRTYKRRVDLALGPGTDVSHIGELHELGFLPLQIKGLDEGTIVPYRVPALTIRNTDPKFFWLTNMLETLMSNVLWLPSTSATTAFEYRKNFEKYAKLTGAPTAFIPWQGHDFSMRGMSGIEAAVLSGAGHLLSFTGTDTIPAIDFLEEYYGANADKELIGGSVPATEHSVMCMGLQAGEFETFKRLITQVYPNGIVSVVSDTWDLWKVLTDFLPRLKESILARNGKLVIRPDSGDPVKILLGDSDALYDTPQWWGVIRLLHNAFGGTTNAQGYIELDPHVGAIYGDSITLERQVEILQGLKAIGFASSNVVLGIGSFTYQHVTRDTDGWAMKATYGERLIPGNEVEGQPTFRKVSQNISKDPITDSGLKKSASGLLKVVNGYDGALYLQENVSWFEEAEGELKTRFLNGAVKNSTKLKEVRKKLESYL